MEMDRRSFLKGSLALGGIAAAGALAGCSQQGANPQSAAETTATDWLGTAPDIAVTDCAQTVETDIVVVGSALAGIVSAYSAIQNGAQVTMIERNGAPHISGSGIGFFNSQYQQQGGQPVHDEQVMMHKVVNEGNLRVDTSLVALWAYHSVRFLLPFSSELLHAALPAG